MADNLPKTQEEARGRIAQQMDALRQQYAQEQTAGTLTRIKDAQIRQQFQDLNKQFALASTGTAGSIGKGLMSGVAQGFGFSGQGANIAAPVLSMPSRIAQTVLNYKLGRTVNEPQSQEQLIPFRAGQGVGNIATGLLTPGNTAKSIGLATGLTAADIGIESQGGPQAVASGVYLAQLLGRGGWQGLKNWREGRKFEDLMKNLPADMPELERNALKRFMLTGQGADNGIVAAAMQKLETKPEFAEMLKKLREGATEQTLSGMRPETGKLTKEQAGIGLVQTIQNKLDGIREHNADSLFEKAKGYGAGQGLVDPTITIGKIDELIDRYSKMTTPNAESAVKALTGIRERLQPTKQAVYGAQPSSTFTVREGTSGFTTPTHPGGVRIVERQVPTYDALGTPTGTKTIREEVPFSSVQGATVAGTPATIGTNPASAGKTVNWQTAPEKLTVEEVQGILSEFGKKASAGNTLIKDLSISDERIISSAIFGGMKDDLASAAKNSTGKDKAALDLLSTARDKVAKASTAYNEAVAQGLPAFLKDKNPASLDFQTLSSEYEKLTPQQRASVRQWVGDTDPEVLKQFDRQVYTNFLDKARDTNGAVDLGKLTSIWNTTKPADRDAVTTALGVNAGEFNARMRDATAFSNRIRVAQPAAEASAIGEVAPPAARLAGTAIGYGAHQGVMLGADIAKQLLDKTKLSDEQLMKLLLSPEGADFLKTQKLTPGSADLLDKITKVTTVPMPPAATVQQVGAQLQEPTQAPVVQPTRPAFQLVDETAPPDEEVTQPQPQEQQKPAFQMVE